VWQFAELHTRRDPHPYATLALPSFVHGPDGKPALAPQVNASLLDVYGPHVRPSQLSVALVLRDGLRLTFPPVRPG